ncbi:MAG: recombinase family protein [Chloroflexota bacterium]
MKSRDSRRTSGRARGYVRESTVGQGDKFGPDAQREAIRRSAADLGLALDESRWYVDLVSGTGRVVRNELAAAIADAGAGPFSTELLVHYTPPESRRYAGRPQHVMACRARLLLRYRARRGRSARA